jgi:DNA invertase Pin-like site-specific DNA recombinase
MTIYAYLRISTDKQDVDNQRHGLLEYANTHKLVPLEFREDTVKGSDQIAVKICSKAPG